MSTTIGMFTTVLVAFTIISAVSSQAPSPAPASVSGGSAAPALGPTAGPSAVDACLGPLSNMTDCLGYVQQGSNSTKPDKNCCPELAGLIEGNPVCLCKLLGTNITEQYGILIDLGRAFKLPSICKISTPSASLCSVAGYPVAAPPGFYTAPGAQPPAGLAASPSTGAKDGSGASSIAGSAHALIVGLAFSVLLSFF